MIIGISPGHGGPIHEDGCENGGHCSACGTKAGADHGIIEADYAAMLAHGLANAFNSSRTYVKLETGLLYIKSSAETVSPIVRGCRARDKRCDMVLAIHVNEGPQHAHGAHMLHRAGDEKAIAVSTVIAKCWPRALKRELHGRRSQGRYIAGMVEPAIKAWWPRAHTLLAAYDPVPTVLIEAFYASNEADCIAANDPLNRMQMVSAMIAGITEAGRVCGDDNDAAEAVAS